MKKILSIVLVLGLMLTLCIPSAMAADRYSDVQANHWAYKYIDYLSGKGVLDGDGNGKFRPDSTVNRAEFIKMIVCTFGLTDSASVSYTKMPDWAATYIQRASAQGFLLSYAPDTDFSEGLVREEAVTLLMRYLALDTSGMTYNKANVTDMDSISSAYRTYVQEAVSAGIISGYADGSFKPKNVVTRAEALTMLYNAAGKLYSAANSYDFNSPYNNVTINGDIALFDTTLNGRIYITEGVQYVSLNNCRINGTIYVRGNTRLTLSGTDPSDLIVNGKAQIILTNGADVGNLKLNATSTVEIGEGCTTKNLYANKTASYSQVTGKGKLAKIWVYTNNVTSTLLPDEYFIDANQSAVLNGFTFKAGSGKTTVTGIQSAYVYGSLGSYKDYISGVIGGNRPIYDSKANVITIKVVPQISGTIYAAAWLGTETAMTAEQIIKARSTYVNTFMDVTAGNTYYIELKVPESYALYNVGIVMTTGSGASFTSYLPMYNYTAIDAQMQVMGLDTPTATVPSLYPTWEAYVSNGYIYVSFDQPMCVATNKGYVALSKLTSDELAALFSVGKYEGWTVVNKNITATYSDGGYYGCYVCLEVDGGLDAQSTYYISLSKLLYDGFGTPPMNTSTYVTTRK